MGQTAVYKNGNLCVPYAKFGTGEKTLVILPGLNVQLVSLLVDAVEQQYAPFTGDYTVYLFDCPSVLTRGVTQAEIAEAIFEAIRSLGLPQFDIFGTSMGGMFAMYLASEHPESVRRLVLGSTAPYLTEIFLPVLKIWRELAKKRDREGLARELVHRLYEAAIAERAEKLFVEQSQNYKDEELERYEILCEAFQTIDLSAERLRHIVCPTLVLGAIGDRVFGIDGMKQIIETVGAEGYFFPLPSGHCVYDETPVFQEKMFAFLHR